MRKGIPCYDNTHYANEDDAWKRLVDEASAGVSLAGREVIEAQATLDRARTRAGEAVAAFVTTQDNRRGRENEQRESR